jgi:hypothetical protein
LILDDTEVTGNESDSHGGGIHTGGILLVRNGSKINGNNTVVANGGDGGGIYQADGAVEILGSEVSGNTADSDGGGIFNNAGTLTVAMASQIDGNTATESLGGGIHTRENLNLSNSTVSGNTAFFGGGILSGAEGTSLIQNSSILNNTATTSGGGGIYAFDAGEVLIQNSTIVGNEALGGDRGGGVVVEASIVTINNSTIFNNVAEGEGGGIFTTSSGTTLFSNSLIAGNTDNGSGAPDCGNDGDMIAFGNNLIQDPTGCTLSGNIAGVLNGDPGLDPNGLQENGGPTETVALVTDSQAIDAGDNATCEPTDQRGTVRPQGPDCDLGAYEAGPSADLSSDQLVFDEQEVGTTSAAQSVTLTNNGSTELVINGIAVTGDFAQSNDCGSSVAPGGSCNISATFSPTVVGVNQGEVTVDSSAGLRSIALLGSGIQGNGGGCSLHPKNASQGPMLGIGLMLAGFVLLRRKISR